MNLPEAILKIQCVCKPCFGKLLPLSMLCNYQYEGNMFEEASIPLSSFNLQPWDVPYMLYDYSKSEGNMLLDICDEFPKEGASVSE